MSARRLPHRGGEIPPPEAIEATLRSQGLGPWTWSNGPGEVYARHAHAYDKVLYCARGSIVFHTPGGDVELQAGDRLELGAGTEHGATVGPDGCTCTEGRRDA